MLRAGSGTRTPARQRFGRLALFLTGLLAVGACDAGSPPPAADNELVQNRGADKDDWWDALPRPEWQAYERIPVDDDWFEAYAVADGVFAIYEPGQFEEVISFLITGRDRALLFDTGLGIGDIRQVVERLTDLEITVLNSHTHYDHVGGNHRFDSILARDTAYTRRNARGAPPEALAEFIQEGWVWKPFPKGFAAADYRTRPFTISRFVREGERIDLGGRVLEIVFTPGHAPDAVCLLDRENRILFTGDTFYLAPLYTHLEGSDFDEFARSAKRIASLAGSFDVMMTAHNVPVVDAEYAYALDRAFEDIKSGRAREIITSDGLREYHFDGFSVIVRGEVGQETE